MWDIGAESHETAPAVLFDSMSRGGQEAEIPNKGSDEHHCAALLSSIREPITIQIGAKETT